MSRRNKKKAVRVLIALLLAVSSLMFSADLRIILFILCYLTAGYDVLWGAVRKIFCGRIFDEEVLMGIATIGALVLKEFFEAAMVMVLFQTGELFQSIAVGKSRNLIKALMKMKPDSATVLRDGKEIEVTPEEVEKGEIILVIPGAKVPLDGEVTEGRTLLDTSSLTGESVPIELAEGGRAISGMINIESPIKIRVSGVYKESTIAKILSLVETSSEHKSASEKFITKFSKKYTPCVFLGALITLIIPTLVMSQSFFVWLKRALVFLVVSCPCALVISVPMAFFGGLGAASRKGILVKGANYLETLSKVDTVAFDKTGTLTKGGFSVTEVYSCGNDQNKLLEYAALAECFSDHPIAVSIVKAYGEEADKSRVSCVKNLPGAGVSALIDGKNVLAGNIKLMQDNGVIVSAGPTEETVVHVAIDNVYMGYISLADTVKPEAVGIVKKLKHLGIKRTLMLTGDNRTVASKISKSLQIDETYFELFPQDKVEMVLKIRGEGKGKVAFVGDGINDAPVLSCADVGIAMGALGSDAAIEAADVVIMNDSIDAVREAIKISRQTSRIVRENIFISLFIKFGVMLLSIFGFDNLYAAIFADVGVMVIAVINSVRMLAKK